MHKELVIGLYFFEYFKSVKRKSRTAQKQRGNLNRFMRYYTVINFSNILFISSDYDNKGDCSTVMVNTLTVNVSQVKYTTSFSLYYMTRLKFKNKVVPIEQHINYNTRIPLHYNKSAIFIRRTLS